MLLRMVLALVYFVAIFLVSNAINRKWSINTIFRYNINFFQCYLPIPLVSTKTSQQPGSTSCRTKRSASPQSHSSNRSTNSILSKAA